MQMPSRDKILEHARALAERTIKEMGLGKGTWLVGYCDNESPEQIMALLSQKISTVMIVAGDWRGNTHDVYDAILRFAEQNFGRMRHKKYSIGTYVVVICSPLENPANLEA